MRVTLTHRHTALVKAPTLVIVGGRDEPVIEMNHARRQMHAHVELEIVPGATHLFEEPRTLEQVARLATDWFTRYLIGTARLSA